MKAMECPQEKSKDGKIVGTAQLRAAAWIRGSKKGHTPKHEVFTSRGPPHQKRGPIWVLKSNPNR